jgi:hypothetical protein
VNQPTGKFWKEREINNIDTEKNHRERRKEKKIQQNKLLMMMKMVEEMVL